MLLTVMLLLLPLSLKAKPAETVDHEAATIAQEAYIYLYPMVAMDTTRRVLTNIPAGVKPGLGPANAFHHMRAFPPSDFRDVVKPNFDTLYSSSWLDLRREPIILSVPDTNGRYYLLPLLDMWSDVFAVPGKRTSGTAPGHYAVVPPGWSGKLPEGIERIEAPTPFVWIIGRTQTNGPADYAAVAKVQDGYALTPLSRWGKSPKAVDFKPDPTVDMKIPPSTQADSMPAERFFDYAADLLKVNPPHLTDWSQLARLKRIGLVPGESFDYAAAPEALRAALDQGVADGQRTIRAAARTVAPVVNGWQMLAGNMGVYGSDYLKRAAIAMTALGANQPEDAMYPQVVADADGNPLVGGQRYRISFAKGETPPADAFWSLTLYDASGFPVPNALKRQAIGDRDALKYNADGSLDIYVQPQSPGSELESNWLPSATAGGVELTMRIYGPKTEVRDGRWVPPPVRRIAD
jgi:hypothetical protein